MKSKKRKQIRISVKRLKALKKGLAFAYYFSISSHKFGIDNPKLINDLFHRTHVVETLLRHNKNKHYVVLK